MVLSGLGTATFERATNALYEAYAMFERTFQEDQLDALEGVRDGKWGVEMKIGNRYLTPKDDAPEMLGKVFATGIDPKGILNRFVASGNYIHGEDNAVEYFVCSVDEAGNQR